MNKPIRLLALVVLSQFTLAAIPAVAEGPAGLHPRFEQALENELELRERIREGILRIQAKSQSDGKLHRGTHAKGACALANLEIFDLAQPVRGVPERILPRLRKFGPELIVISAGFDAHRRDPLANLQLVDTDFAWVTRALMEVADKTAEGRLISTLEGGYDLEGLTQSAAAHVMALMHG